MSFDIKGLLAGLKLQPKYIVAVAIATGFMLFAPQRALDATALTGVQPTCAPFLGVIFTLACALLISHLACAIIARIKCNIQASAARKTGIKRLNNLTRQERSCLYNFVSEDIRAYEFDSSEGTMQVLLEAGLITIEKSAPSTGVFCVCQIIPWVWEYLKQHPELVKIEHNK